MHALVSLTEMIGIALENTLLPKLNHYSIRRVAFDWFQSYLSDRNQLLPSIIKDLKSKILNMVYCKVPS